MIEINLLPGSGKKARGTGFNFTAIASRAGSRVKDPFMIGAAVSIVAAIGSIGFLHITQMARAEELTERERRAVQDSTRYVAVLRERNRAEAQRDSVRRQLEIIKAIDNDRFIWPHVMDEVSRAMPPYTWLKGIQQIAVLAPPPPPPSNPGEKAAPAPAPTPSTMKFQVSGHTVDIQALTRFMKLLESSPFVKNVTIAKAELVAVDGKEVQEFLLECEYERPEESVIATVPVTLSSR
jgi:Tfp pilus assembly protein PilN